MTPDPIVRTERHGRRVLVTLDREGSVPVRVAYADNGAVEVTIEDREGSPMVLRFRGRTGTE